jgi:hypothetical protein
MDEAMLPLTHQNGEEDFYHEPNDPEKRRPCLHLAIQKPSYLQQRMFAAGVGWKGQSRLYVVEPEAEVNSEYFIKNIPSSMMLEDVPRLHGTNADMVILHFDCACSHIAELTYHWLDAQEISCITKEEWSENSPEISAMDFFANGYFKNQLAKRKYRRMAGISRAA